MFLAHLRSFSAPARALAPILMLSVGCPADDDETADAGEDAGDDAAMLPDGCDALVEAGSDDQTAVQEAFIEVQSGETVCLGAGTFSFTRQLTLEADGVTLKGDSAATTILDFSGQISGGNGLSITGDDTRTVVFDPESWAATTIAFTRGGYVDGPLADAEFRDIGGVAETADGTILFSDTTNNAVRALRPNGTVETERDNVRFG